MDRALIDAIELMTEGREEGFNKVYSETYNHVYFRAKSYMKNEEDALDLVQIVYVEAYRNIGSLQTPEALFGWLDGITYRQGMKQYRKKKDVLLSEEGEGIFEILETEDISSMPELTADQKETSKIIRELIEELPVLQKIAMIAYYFDNLSIGQIAEIQECSEGTVKSRLNYGRKYLKDRIEEKEKKEGYRLHVFTLPTLYFAIKMLAEETTMTVHAAQGVYNASCTAAGLTAGTITAQAAATSGVAGGAQAAAAAGAGKAAGIGAKFASLSTAMKATVIASTLAVGTAAVGGAAYVATNEPVVESDVIDDGSNEILPEETSEIEQLSFEDDLSVCISLNKYSETEKRFNPVVYPTQIGDQVYCFESADIMEYFSTGETIELALNSMTPEGMTVGAVQFKHFETKELVTYTYDATTDYYSLCCDVSGDIIVTLVKAGESVDVIDVVEEEQNSTDLAEAEQSSISLTEAEKMQIVDAIAYFGCMMDGGNVDYYVSTVRSYIQTMQKGDGVNAVPCGWTSDIVTEESVKAFYEDGMGIMVPDDYTYNDYGITCNSELEGDAGADYFKYNSLDIAKKEDGTYVLTGAFVWGAEGEEDLYSFEAVAVESGNSNVFGGLQIKGYTIIE